MKLFKKIVGLSFCLVFGFLQAQQDPHFSQYMFNTMTVNPGYAGSQGFAAATFISRSQWVGVKGAPNTQTLSFDLPTRWKGVGLGLNAVNDQVGPAHEIYLDANASYAINTGEKSKLSFGLKLGTRLLNVDMSKLNPSQTRSADPNLVDLNEYFLTVGAGLFYYTDKYYLGLSVPNFIPSDHYEDKNIKISSERFHTYLIAGYVFDLNEKVKFKPSLLTKAVSGSPLSIDLSANFLFIDKVSAGLTWRVNDAIGGMLGFRVSDEFLLGYVYDLTTTEFRIVNNGTHEIMLKYEFRKSTSNSSTLNTTRFF